MHFWQALRRTMFEFNITGVELSKASGVTQSQISGFKNNTLSLTTDNLEKLINGLPSEARTYFYSLLQSPSAAEAGGQYAGKRV